jgi:hypothetical protein
MPPARNNVHNPNNSAIREPDPLAMKITSKEIELGNSNPKRPSDFPLGRSL